MNIISGPTTWGLTTANFVNPSYLARPAEQAPVPTVDALGFDISEGPEAVAIAFEGTYSGQVVAHQQTLDPNGLTGWFTVAAQSAASVGTTTPVTDGSTSGVCYVFAARGARHRIVVSALSTGTIIARISGQDSPADLMAAMTGTGTVAAQVQGNVASGVADAGNPVKVGAKFNTVLPTYADGQRGDAQIDSSGRLYVTLGGVQTGAVDAASNSSTSLFQVTGSAGGYLGIRPWLSNGTTWDRQRSIQGADGTGLGVMATAVAPQAAAAGGNTNVVTAAVASSLVLKATPGNLYDVNIVTGGSAGYLMIFNATSAPADGAVTPARCYAIAANASYTQLFDPCPLAFTVGITLVFSTTGPFTKTASATAFLAGAAK